MWFGFGPFHFTSLSSQIPSILTDIVSHTAILRVSVQKNEIKVKIEHEKIITPHLLVQPKAI